MSRRGNARDSPRGLIRVDREEARRVAKDLVEQFGKVRFRDPDESFYYVWPHGWAEHVESRVKLWDVKGRERHVPVSFAIRDPSPELWRAGRKYVTGGHLVTRWLDHYSYPMKMEVFLNNDHSPEELKANTERFEEEIYHVLLHEMTHAQDVLEHPSTTTPPETPEHYHNIPSEVRAFKQQIVEEVTRELDRRYAGDSDPAWIDTSGEAIEDLLATSQTWDRIQSTLTPANRKSILRTVADSAIMFRERVRTASNPRADLGALKRRLMR